MEPKIIFEDEELLVVDKPSGMIVYPDGRHDYPALSNWLERYKKTHWPDKEFYFVHRIDRETSGILVIAKTPAAHEFLKEQFQNREIKKTYRAFVYGTLKDDRGMIEKPIGSARGGLGPRSATRPHGTMREAQTLYRVLARTLLDKKGGEASYVEAFPKTGRTHQIRVHFSAIQHPIICDQLYAPQRAPLLGFNRLALHAFSISFEHPNGKQMTFEAPLPQDFIEAERQLAAKTA
ncbi:MAG: RluA family pseudouridine synthase [Patescibacteria group bacterium]|nr:RluA family pseudouridine synthase [Patescibacteria group bacterium]